MRTYGLEGVENEAGFACNFTPAARLARPHFGQVAQSVEQWTENPRVGGSIPSLTTQGVLSRCDSTPCVVLSQSWLIPSQTTFQQRLSAVEVKLPTTQEFTMYSLRWHLNDWAPAVVDYFDRPLKMWYHALRKVGEKSCNYPIFFQKPVVSEFRTRA